MKAIEIIKKFEDVVSATDPALMNKIQVQAAHAQMQIHELHARAIACHCECLGMNAENSIAACKGQELLNNDINYQFVMNKWGLTDKDGKVII